MTRPARALAVSVGIVLLLLSGAALVRHTAMAADVGVSWPVAVWWSELTARPATVTTVAAVVAAACAGLLIALTLRQVLPPTAPQVIEYAVPEGTARLSVPALSKALRHRFEAMLPGSSVSAVNVSRDDEGWAVRIEADVPVCDLREVQEATLKAFRDDMRRVAGIEVVHLDIVAGAMRPPPRKSR